ncbi:MAG TPA: hypothetical protein VFS28_02905 [Gemmatimonadales bacterium]|nr:hypothetical protein [Gemmatimonadales bacterium]
MTGTASIREPGDEGAEGRPSQPDVWGVRRAENLLSSLAGVLSARVVTTPLGEVSEVHVLAQAGVAPKQVVRNVESALLAHLGLKVDHRKISVAQTAEVQPIKAVEQDAVRQRALQRAVLFEGLQVGPGRKHRVSVQVALGFDGRSASEAQEATDTPKGRMEAAARAAASVIDQLLGDHSVALDGVKLVEAFDKEVVLAAVQGLGGRQPVLLIGTAVVRESAEMASVLAVLDATNRWADVRR